MSKEFSASPAGHDELDHGSILAPSPVLLFLTFVFGVVLNRVKRIEVLSRPWNLVVGGLSFMVGTALFVNAIRTMRSADTGPSHDDDPPELITEGVFQYTRNPIYLGNCLQYVGAALLYNSLWSFVVLTPVVAYFDRVVDREEAYLESRFGEEFESYREDVRRWI